MKKSLVCKHLVIFGCIIALIVGATTGLQIASMNNIRNAAYETMDTQISYYLGMIDKEISHMRRVQISFFSDRKLVSIVAPEINPSPL